MSSPLSAFTAVPNPQMLAFMGTQSFIMMYQAGEGWQYGKRKQSAMSNEEFNKQTPLSIMDRQRQELINALPSIADSMNAMTPLIKTIVTQYGDFISEAIKATPEAIGNVTQFPFTANAETTQKQFQASQPTANDFMQQLTALLKLITGQGIKSGSDIHGTQFISETDAERKANDKLIEDETLKLTTEEYKKIREQNKFGNIVPKQPVISAPSVHKSGSYEQAQYQNKTFTLKKEISTQKEVISIAQKNLKNKWISQNHYNSLYSNTKIKLVRARKTLMNHITHARNNIVTKSLATRDWNDKIWL